MGYFKRAEFWHRTGFAFLARDLRKKLEAMKLSVPLIDPLAVTIHTLAVLLDAGLTHSRVAYPGIRASLTSKT